MQMPRSLSAVVLALGMYAAWPALATEAQVSVPAGSRTPVALSVEEREFVLNEMRFYLDMLYVATDALSRDDMRTVASAARRRGTSALARVPEGLYDRTPAAFREGIRESRELVDRIAVEAETASDSRPVLRRVGQLLYLCNACHSTYQLNAIPSASRQRGR